jgi:Amt family ammonium transporter
MCDIDDFTGVNDSLGRLRSDRYLVEVGRSLSQLAGPHDVVARVGSDEFAFLTTGAATDGAAQQLAERVRRTLQEGVMVGERRLTAAASIGVAWAPPGGRPSDLLNIADLALHRSKAAGGDTVTMGCDRVSSGSGPVEMESQLRTAVEQGQFVVHYQPIVELSDGRIRAVEALVRWQHPTRGLIYPGDFIPAAERRHLIADIGLVVLEQVCRQSRQWYDVLGEPVRISINVSTAQLVRPGLASAIAHRAAKAGIEPKCLQLEITESQLLSADESTLSHLWACRDVGCELAIDDFGTGHAGFDYLRRIPAHVLKIDKTFIDGLGVDSADRAIVAGVIAVGHGMGLKVVAEGVEKADQATTLRAAGCDAAQGWLWARALPSDEVLPLLRAGRVTP